MPYLLDTNVLSDFVRAEPSVKERILAESPALLAVSTITVMEIDYGLALDPSRARRIRPAVEAFLGAISVYDLTREDARAAGTVRAALKKAGRPIGPYDVLIAGCALARGCVLVSANVSEFSRVQGLVVENWRG